MRLAGLLVALLAVPVQAPAGASRIGTELPIRLPADAQTAAVILAAEDRRDPSAELLTLTQSTDGEVRGRAAIALGRIGRPSELPRLLEMLSDPEPAVRASAAFALGRLEYELAAAIAAALRTRAVERLVPLLDDEPVVAEQAAWAIGQAAAGRDELARWLGANAPAIGTAAPSDAVLAAVIEAWWRQPEADVDPLRPFARSVSAAVRLAVAHALRRLVDPNAWPMLVPMLDDGDAEVRLMALKGLRRAPESIAVAHAIRFLSDRDWRAQCEAANWFGRAWREQQGAPDDAAFEAVLRRTLDRRLHVRRCALAAMGAVGGERAVAVDRLLEAVTEEEPAVRAVALTALTEVGGGAVEEALRRWRTQAQLPDSISAASSEGLIEALRHNPVEARALAEALMATGRPEDQEWIEIMLLQGPERLRAFVFERVAPLDPEGAWRLAQGWFAEGSVPERVAAAGVIGRLVREGSVTVEEEERIDLGERLWRQYFDLSGTEAAAVRMAALEALVVIDRELVVARASLLLEDPDRVIRRHGLGLLEGEPEVERLLNRAGEKKLAQQATGRDATEYQRLAARAIDLQDRELLVDVQTSRGAVVIRLRADLAPLTVVQLVGLIEAGFYDQSLFNRVVAGFVAQGGGRITPPWAAAALRNEDSPVAYTGGVVGLALAGRDTGAAQFFITQAPQPHLTGNYPVIGEVIEGRRIADRIQPGDRMQLSLRR